MTRCMVLLAVAACGGSTPATTTTTAPQPRTQPTTASEDTRDALPPAIPAPPADDARRTGFPSDEMCRAAVERGRLLAKDDPASHVLKAYEADFMEGNLRVCRHQWVLAEVDCKLAANDSYQFEQCSMKDWSPSDPNYDPSGSIGHMGEPDCEALKEHLAAIGDAPKDGDFVAHCRRTYRRANVECFAKATTKEQLAECREWM